MNANETLKKEILSSNSFKVLFSKAKIQILKKKELLLTPGKKVNKLFFIKSGFLRGYRIIDGEEITHHFFVENWFSTDYESYLTGEVGELYIEALIDTEVYLIEKETLDCLYHQSIEFQHFGRILAEDSFLQTVSKLINLQTKDLKGRYNILISKNPDLFKKVPQKYIASYLGVKPQSLSRIKSNVIK